MSTADVAKQFTTALKAGKYEDAERLWSDDVVSYEAMEGPMSFSWLPRVRAARFCQENNLCSSVQL